MLHILNCISPVFLLILFGWLLRRYGFLPEAFFEGLIKLVYWVALPAFLFVKIATSQFEGGSAMRVFWAVLGVMLLSIAVARVTARLRPYPRRSHGALTQAIFRGNLAFVGLPIIAYAFADLSPDEHARVVAYAVFVLAPIVPIYNIAAVIVLIAGKGDDQGASPWRSMAGALITNPLILGCLLALPFCLGSVEIPVALLRTGESLAQIALPLALLGIGASPALRSMRAKPLDAVIPAVLRVVLGPALAWGLSWALGLNPEEARVAMIYAACPTAVASYVLVNQIGGDDALAGSTVMTSTMLAVPSLAVVLYVTG